MELLFSYRRCLGKIAGACRDENARCWSQLGLACQDLIVGEGAMRTKATRERVRTLKLRETEKCPSGVFRTKCFGSAMRPRIASNPTGSDANQPPSLAGFFS